MSLNHNVIGGIAALLSSAAWALDPIILKKLGDRVTPQGMNLGRGILGIPMILVLLIFFGVGPIPLSSLTYLSLSGILGVALGDTFFLMGLLLLGPRLAVIIETLCPAISVLLAVLFLGERPTPLVWTGIALTIAGVNWVLFERSHREKLKADWLKGVIYGLISVGCTSAGILFAKVGVAQVSAVPGTFIRLFAATIALLLWSLATGKTASWLTPLREKKNLGMLAIAVFLGICLGLLLSLVALKLADASIAVPLNSTTPLFILPISALVFREKITFRTIVGAAIAVSGITLIFLFG